MPELGFIPPFTQADQTQQNLNCKPGNKPFGDGLGVERSYTTRRIYISINPRMRIRGAGGPGR